MTSSTSVYKRLHPNTAEEEFDALAHPLVWCARQQFAYSEGKRQAECALFQAYPHIPAVAVRLPYVIGPDDYTRRLFFYADHVVNGIPMYIDNPDAEIGFVQSAEAGRFIAWLAGQALTGAVNGASPGCIAVGAILKYVERAAGKPAMLAPNSENAPYNQTPGYTINVEKARRHGFEFTPLAGWIYRLLDDLITEAGARQ